MFGSARLRTLVRDEAGAVAIMFGLVLVPLIAFGGAAVDYGRAQKAAALLQSGLDMAALAAAAKGPDLTKAELDALARDIVARRMAGSDALVEDVVPTREDEVIIVRGSARMPTAFMKLIGIDEVPIGAEARSTYGRRNIDIALVLDNTGSMSSSGKMTELKRALCGDATCSGAAGSSGFVAIMREAAREADRIRVGLVPFDTTVRMPLAVQKDVAAALPAATTFHAPETNGYCGTASSDAAQRVSWFRFATHDKDAATACGGARAAPATWNGCVWDRDRESDRDVTDAGVATGDVATLHPAVTCRNANLARLAPLADIWTRSGEMYSALGAMQPSGNTNLTIGVSWGLALMTPQAPFAEAATLPAGVQPDDVLRYMIVLTDGENTENKFGKSAGSIDKRTTEACDAAKAAGITVVSVRVIAGDRNLLRGCASSPDLYYEVNQASQLTSAFRAIAERIGSVRLTH